MKKILLFDPELSGHHLEYLWHLYSYLRKQEDREAIFVVHPSFQERNRFFSMPDLPHIRFVSLNEALYRKINVFWSLKSAYWKCKILNHYLKEYNPDYTVLITLFSFFPFIPFLSGKSKIRGIVYSIYLRKKLSFASRLMHRCFFYEMSRKRSMDKIFLLNDTSSAWQMNVCYSSQKYLPLPDPFLVPPASDIGVENDLISLCQFDTEVARRYIHFGSMSRRKGTLVVLEAFLAYSGVSKISLVLLGKVADEIQTEFYTKVALLEKKTNVELFFKDAFCSYAAIGSAMPACDYILMPYYNTSQSSGMLGYAAFYNKPVIGPVEGLIGELIQKYGLGYTLPAISSASLSEVLSDTISKEPPCINGVHYLADNSADNFAQLLLN